ncbi:MAG: hypothetical protein WC374_10590 [Phycisphaerae bacterium]|jgi:hypothetical protein
MDIEDSIIRGSVKAATKIYNALLSSGAIVVNPAIEREIAAIISKFIIVEMEADQKKGGE